MRDETATAAENAVQLALAYCTACIFIWYSPAFAQLSDPMAPPGASAPGGSLGASGSRGASELQGVISGPGRRLAVINGNVVQVGETIPGNGELLYVGPDSATVRSSEKYIQLRLHPDSVKRGARP